ncbi:MAG: methyltransferase domain-containing protein [Desulfovibrionales bacterium]|nr:methyltransferase domain-containing protein [Desulfovibrionales bacterium]
MHWKTTEQARAYDTWATHPQGMFALQQERRLLQNMLAPWPRRKQKLLDIGCGTGFFLDFFWEGGFDVTGIDISPAMLALAREKKGHRSDLHVGSAEHLPFADREFDYASLLTVLEFVDDPGLALREAARVSRKGIVLLFLNKLSLYRCSVRLSRMDTALSRVQWFSWWRMRALIQKNLPSCYMRARSVLVGPPFTWRPVLGLRHLNSLFLPPWCGAVTAVRIDLTAPYAQTPLMAWETEPSA